MPDNPVRDVIAGHMRAELARAKKTQREFAAALGIDQASLWLRLNSQRSFRAEEIVLAAQYFGVPVEQLTGVPERAS